MAKKKSYNPFYIPSLDALKAQARQEAQAQVDAAVAALPKQADVQGQFDKSGREFRAMDTGYLNFLKGMQTSAPAMMDTGFDPMVTPGANFVAPDASQEAKQASNALAMQGFGFANARTASIAGAAGKINENQARNRRQLNDALLQLTQQIGAEKAKFSPLYYQTLNQKKQDAFQAYQAYLANQFNSAQLGANVANDQANIDIRQQNADTAATRAADAARKTAATAGDKSKATRIKLREAAFKFADQELAKTSTSKQTTRFVTYHVTYQAPSSGGKPGAIKTITVEYPESISQDQAFANVKHDNPGILNWKGISPYKTREESKDVAKKVYDYKFVYGRLYRRLKRAGYTSKQAKRFADNYLNDLEDLVGSPAWRAKQGNTGRPGGDQ